MRMIRFVTPLYGYRYAVASIVLPIMEELNKLGVEAITETLPEDDSVNVYSFFESNYLKEVGGLVGTTVHLPHGVADKDYRTAEKMKMFDYCVVEGQFHVDKLKTDTFPAKKMLVGGFAKFSLLDLVEKNFRENFKASALPNRPINVLYAPTHSGKDGNLCSLLHPKNGDVIEQLSDSRFNILSSLHPHNNENGQCTTELLAMADVVVSDCSSVIYEAWHLGKPVVFLDFLVAEYIAKYYPFSAENVIYAQKIGRHAKDWTEAKKLIIEANSRGITHDERFMLNMVSNSELRKNAPKIIAKQLAKIGGYKI